ncbi:MAG: hypothetical protein ACRC62_09995 [Microcoleus sp.]
MSRFHKLIPSIFALVLLLQIFRPQPDGTWRYTSPDKALHPAALWLSQNSTALWQRSQKAWDAVSRDCGQNGFLCEGDRWERGWEAVRGE